jgi:hypothetical protein
MACINIDRAIQGTHVKADRELLLNMQLRGTFFHRSFAVIW